MISSVVPTNFPFVRGLTPNKNSILSESVVDAGRRRPDCPLVPKGDVISQPPDGTQNGPIRPTSRILLSLAGFGATTMTSPSRGRTPSIAIMFSPWVTTTSVPGPRHAPIVSRAPAVSAHGVQYKGIVESGRIFYRTDVHQIGRLPAAAPLGADNLANLNPLRAKAFTEGVRLRAPLFTRPDRRPGPAPRHGGSKQRVRRRAARSMLMRCRRRRWPRRQLT